MKDGKTIIYTAAAWSRYNATIYYRLAKPLGSIERGGAAVETIFDVLEADIPHEDRAISQMSSDIFLVYNPTNNVALRNILSLREQRPRRVDDENGWWPPMIVVDTDDDIFNVHPLNSAFGYLGTRVNGQELGEGATVDFELNEFTPREGLSPKDQSKLFERDGKWYVRQWEDGVNKFSVRDNLIKLASFKNWLAAANLVTCSTPRCEAYVKREVPSANTFVTYNPVDINDYPQDIELAPSNKIRILWQGSPTHFEDLWPITPAIQRIAKDYPNVEFIFWGAPYKWATANLGAQARLLPWCDYHEYKVRLSTIGHDINLCPLQPHIFNQARSAIKFYESSIISKPAATLAQRAGAYQDEIIAGETGLMWDTPEEFEARLRLLIDSEGLRNNLRWNARQWVLQNRDAQVLAKRLWNKYAEVLEAHRADCGTPLEVKPDVPAEHDHSNAGPDADQ